MAEISDISVRALSGIEIGETFMSAQTMEKLLMHLGVTLGELFSVDHLKPTEELINEIEQVIYNLKNDREKIENIYKIIKAINNV